VVSNGVLMTYHHRVLIAGTLKELTFKLLRVVPVIISDLTWDAHVSYILSKCAKRIYCIWTLSKAGVLACDIVYIYCSVVRSVLEYACAVWHPGLSNKLSEDIERFQKCCFKIIYTTLSYSEALEKSGLVRLDTRREEITQCTIRQVKCPTHPLHYIRARIDKAILGHR